MTDRTVLYCAPGSGLGHLNRALAVCLELRELGVSARIVTNSPFAEGVARLARFPIAGIAGEHWREDVRSYAEALRPALVIADTFPRGMRGEWENGFPAPAVYLARRLNTAATAALFARSTWAEGLALIVEAEPLGSDHAAMLRASDPPVESLPGPIRLRPGLIATPIPAPLERLLDGQRSCLVVHGGPVEEVYRLIETAQGRGPVAVVTPWSVRAGEAPVFEYYPAGNIVHRAGHVVTAAGYNAMADMMHLRERHTAVPFPRRFDDQAARLAAWRETPVDGTREAAQAIAALMV
ncbi:MAG TPA: hypothetical protein DEH78_18850 [Solibacterales bacterium]|nr:hypothetical protein [Bryobacterales bacterium]